jgi:predicted transglutaminase-like cysteine proteinase
MLDARFEGRGMLRILGVIAAFICIVSPAKAVDERAAAPASETLASALVMKWQDVQRRIIDDEARLSKCRAAPWACNDDEMRFEAIVASGRAREGRARIGEINRAVNLAIRPVSDERRFGVVDRWSSPLETVSDGAGDCEDYAILKILALREAGVATDDLKLLIVYDRATRSDHAVAAVRLEGRWLVLDNRRFALVDLDVMPYRLLANLDPETEGVHHALLGKDSPDAQREVM